MSHILALDLSLTATGMCWGTPAIDVPHVDTIQTTPKLGSVEERILVIEATLTPYIAAASLVVVEDYALHGPGDKGKTGMVHGGVRTKIVAQRSPMLLVSPSTLKKYATGKGNANKALMLAEAIKRLGFDGHDDNEVDALWLYALGRHVVGDPIVDLPQTHLAALDKLDLSVLDGVTRPGMSPGEQ